jgi:hypothetical protein
MFAFITMNWRAKPLVSHEVTVKPVTGARTKSGLTVSAELDANSYPKGVVVTDAGLAGVRIEPDKSLGDWNYRIRSGYLDHVMSERAPSACAPEPPSGGPPPAPRPTRTLPHSGCRSRLAAQLGRLQPTVDAAEQGASG